MADRVTPVRVFISSPGDLFPERDVVKRVVEELNRSPRYLNRYKLIPYAYEDSTPALIGAEPQAVVDEYLLRPEAADIFVGMLWLRMGTPQDTINPETGAPYQSGTEYELLTAYRAGQERGWPMILLYRCKRPAELDSLDLEQFARVNTLFARFRAGGDLRGLVGEFRAEEELRQTLRRDLEQLLEHDLPAREASAPERMPATGALFFVPSSLPSGYIERTEAIDLLRKALLGSRETVGVVAAAALHGLGGLGKTVLARAICDDPAVRGAFPDGVLWATLGQNAEPARHQRDWIGALGGDLTAASSLESGKVELGRLLAERAVLLVLDDVWNAPDAEWLRAGGPRCGVLITTRDATQAEGAALVELELMRRSESRALLRAAGARQIDDALADAIAERLGHLPLALKIVGAMLAKRIPWPDIAEALDEGDLAFLEHGQGSVLATIKASVDRLPADDAARYRELAIFPQDEPLVEAAVTRLWAQTGEIKARDVRRLLSEFRDRVLVQADNTLHDLQHDYLRSASLPDDQRRWHSALANSYRSSSAWSALPDDDELYGWRRLAYHLARAERNDDLRSLLTDGAYLQGKIARLGTAALLDDVMLLPGDAIFNRLDRAIRLGAYILDREPYELENQLCGRLGPMSTLHHLPKYDGPCFRLESQTLLPPGGALVRIMAGHSGAIFSCALSVDGRLALSASNDETLRLWDVRTGQTVRMLEGHTQAVMGCTFSPDGRLAISASTDKTLRLWDVRTGQTVRMLEGHTQGVAGCAFTSDGLMALSTSWDRTLRVWDMRTGETVRVLEGHTSLVSSCAFSPDGRLALSASDDRTLRLWDVRTGETVRVLEGHSSYVNSCAFSPDGRLAISASTDKTLRLWDVMTGDTVRVLEGHTSAVKSCAFSLDGRLLLSASMDSTLRLWNPMTGEIMRVLEGHASYVDSCAFSPDGRFALSASEDKTLRLWDLSAEQAKRAFESHTDAIYGCTFSSDGRSALSASSDQTLRLWDTASEQTVRVLEGHTGGLRACAFSLDGRLALSASEDTKLQLWDLHPGWSVRTLVGHQDYVLDCAFSPDGRFALSASKDCTLRVWNVTSGQTIRVLEGHDFGVSSCAFSPDGRFALSGSWDKSLRLWDLATGKMIRLLEGHTLMVHDCALSPDGRFALSASWDKSLRIWEFETGQTMRILEGHTNGVNSCVFNQNGQFILSASADRTLRLWQLSTGTEIAHWTADAPLRCCAFHPDGRHVIAGDSLGNLHWLRIEGI